MAGTTWNVLALGKKVKSQQLNDNFDWLEGSLLPMNVGSTTTNVYDLGSALARWRDVYVGRNIIAYEDIKLSSTKKIYLDGGYNTYIAETSADQVDIYVGSSMALSLKNTDVLVGNTRNLIVSPTKGIYLDGGYNTYIAETSADQVDIFCGGARILSLQDGELVVDSAGIRLANTTCGLSFNMVTSTSLDFISGNTLQGFVHSADMYIDGSYNTFSPWIKADPEFKDKEFITGEDYLKWALKDALKPIKPYKGFPKLKNKDEGETVTMDHCFDTKEEAQEERKKYKKGLGKISIGVAHWAEWANNKIKELETKIEELQHA